MAKPHRTKHSTRNGSKHKRANQDMAKKLIIAIVAVFVLIVIAAIYIFVSEKDVGDGELTPEESLALTCDEWCTAVSVNEWCDFELSIGQGGASGSCYGFANSPLYTHVGVQKCPAIDCNNRPVVDQTCVAGLGGTWETPNAQGGCDSIGERERFVLTPTDSPPTTGQVCCG